MGNGHVVESAGGAEKVLCNMANELTLRGHQVTAMCNDIKEGLPFYPLMKEVNFVNLDGSGSKKKKQYPQIKKIVRELTRPLRKTVLYSLFPDPVERQRQYEFCSLIKGVIRCIQPDVVISYFLDDHDCIVKAIGHDRPLLVMHHGNPDTGLLNVARNKLDSLRHCDCLQLLLPSFAKTVQTALPWVRTLTIPNAVAHVEERNMAHPGENRDEHVITMLGRLNKDKQQHRLIRSFSYLAKEYPQWKVHVYGGNAFPLDYEDYLKSLIHELKLENQVFLMGTTDKPSDALRKSDIFAFPTAFEGFPLALTEAMAVGLPCVGLKTTSAVNELIVDGVNGLLAENSPEDFAAKLKILMDDPNLRVNMGRAGHEMMKQYAPEKIWDQWENLITEVVQQYRQRKAA